MGGMAGVAATPNGVGNMKITKIPPFFFRYLLHWLPLHVMERKLTGSTPRDQIAGSMACIRMARKYKRVCLVNSITDPIYHQMFKNCDIHVYNDLAKCLQDCAKVAPVAEVAVFQHGGTGFIRWP